MDTYNLAMILIFVIGYLFIIFEHQIGINKATSALFTAVILWALQFHIHQGASFEHLNQHLANITAVILFLFGALTIVEMIHAHGGFNLVAQWINLHSKVATLWVISIITFFLSAVLDNLTTTIVMVMLIKKIIANREDRLCFGSAVVIAANAGGAWTPIGDVTTTMLWVGGQISTGPTITALFLPSLACLVVALAFFSYLLRGKKAEILEKQALTIDPAGKALFILGIILLVLVPVFKMVTGLPPFMGMLFSVSILWLVTDLMHRHDDTSQHLRILSILPRVDFSGMIFFLGILLSVGALETAGLLHDLADWLNSTVTSKEALATYVGIISAIIDNIPLVAACMGMYDLATYPMDSTLWQLIAYTAGTGGSLLIIGSAAGVAFMGIEKVDFFWYIRKATIPAALGYFAGIGVYLLM